MSDHIEDWLQYLRLDRLRSPETVRTYQSIMRTYHPNPLAATVDDAETWWQNQRHLSPRTRAKNLAAVRSFYKWAIRYDLTLADPTRRLDPPNLPKGTPRYVTRTQLDHLLKVLPPDLRRGACLGAWAGLRVSEAAALHWTDIDLEMRRIHVRHGKGMKSRSVGAHPILLDALLPDTGGNVITGGDREYDAAAFQRRINRAMKRSGVDATFHQLRHRFGTMTYGATGDPLAVAAAMGHASLNTTRIYAAVTDDALDRVAAAAVR